MSMAESTRLALLRPCRQRPSTFLLVGDRVEIEAEIQAVKQAAAQVA